ncbi:hypothetical protein INT47_012323 [Mucor saturninus]|uniref:L-ascorbate oxidase n=1 Tax=Mucor saturninus TaxID=64648 RepID=A0A8H7QXG4_9FUNG|nr:hypothetical protein INT47_012323 [Mucor saturninus]
MTRLIRLVHLVCLALLANNVVRAESTVQSNPITRYYEFNVTQQSINPDCSDHTSPVFLINQQMPGPAIVANQGDTLHIRIRNQLSEVPTHHHNVAIHFHGIRQYGSSEADGVPYLTQLPIRPGEEFVHEFRIVNQAGTFFYHAHVGLQEETVFGPFIVYESQEANPEVLINPTGKEIVASNHSISRFTPPVLRGGPFEYDDERTLILSEWWHRPHLEFEKFIMGPNFTFLPEADSILINGHTLHSSRRATVAKCGGYEVIPVQPNKTYRIRVIGATTFRTLGFGIANHNLTIIEVDGEMIKPYTVSQLEVAPGQRFSVLLHTDQMPEDYAIQVVRRWSDNVERVTNGLAVLHYPQLLSRLSKTIPEANSRGILRLKKPVMLEAPSIRPKFEKAAQESPYWIWNNLEPFYGVDPVVRKPASRTIKLRSVERRLPDGTSRFQVNGVAYSEGMSSNQQPILHGILNNTRMLPGRYDTSKSNGYDPNLRTYPLKHFEIVDIVIQNTHMAFEPCRSHPWHTHGHSHWEIANGQGEYDEERDGDIRNIEHPIQKDITMNYPNVDPSLFMNNGTKVTTPVGCGWSKIRIVADNPGVWAVHCHNTPHMLMGMMVALEEAPELIRKIQ